MPARCSRCIRSHACATRDRARTEIEVRAVQAEIATRNKAGLVRPAFEDLAAFEQFVKPGRWIGTEPREQHEVWAARYDMDRVDLQQLHALDRGERRGA